MSWKPFSEIADAPGNAARESARYSGCRMGGRHPYAILTCDACGAPVASPLAGRLPVEADSASLPGSGLLVFSRGGEVHYEEPPLCARCSVAIGVTALVRWAEEEEEG